MSNIHPNACVESGAKIGKNVTIEPFAVVKKNVTVEDGVTIKSHAYIDGYTTIGANSVIWPGATIGTKPQDLKYQGEKTYITIGEGCEIREFATINASCQENSVVSVGDYSLIMAYCHVAHNCSIGKRAILANGVMLAGHVTIEDHAIIGGMTPIHQFTRIGTYAMVGGFSRVSHDIPPYTLGGGVPYKFGGLNLVGLKRNGFALKVRQALSKVFKITYRSGLRLDEALQAIEDEMEDLAEVRHWIEFCRTSKRGLIGLEGVGRMEFENSEEEFLESESTATV